VRPRLDHLLAAGVGVGGVLAALLVPEALVARLRVDFIGMPGPFAPHASHRAIAVLGAVLGGLTLRRIADEPPRRALVPRVLVPAAVAFALLVLLNVRWAGVSLGVWRWWWPWAGVAYLPLVATLALIVIGGMLLAARPDPRALVRGVPLAVCAGAAYGAFSTLWHCCNPLWENEYGRGPLVALGTAAGLAAGCLALVGFVGIVAARLPWPTAALAGALLLGLVYPWHTASFFVQCLVGGALVAWLVRATGNVLAGGWLGAAAFATHMTLPFMGWWGVLPPLALGAWLLLQRAAVSPGAPAPNRGSDRVTTCSPPSPDPPTP
jgi:hypothetical protein